MSFFETFDGDLGDYTLYPGSEGGHDGDYGNPTAGSAKLVGRGIGAPGGDVASLLLNDTDTYTLVANAPNVYCNARFLSSGGSMDWCMYPLIWTIGFQVEASLVYYLPGTGFGTDSGWVQLTFPLTGRNIGAIIDEMRFYVPVPGASPATCGSSLVVTAYIDSITIGTPPTLGPGEPAPSGSPGFTHSSAGIPGSVLI